jgi:hypothetical protein
MQKIADNIASENHFAKKLPNSLQPKNGKKCKGLQIILNNCMSFHLPKSFNKNAKDSIKIYKNASSMGNVREMSSYQMSPSICRNILYNLNVSL